MTALATYRQGLRDGKGLLLLGLVIQALVGAGFPIFTHYEVVCEGPIGTNPLPCDRIPISNPQTALVYLWVSGAWLALVLFLLMAAFVLFAAWRGNRALKAIALAVGFLSSIVALVAAIRNIPTDLGGYTFLALLLVGVLLQGFGQVESLRRSYAK